MEYRICEMGPKRAGIFILAVCLGIATLTRAEQPLGSFACGKSSLQKMSVTRTDCDSEGFCALKVSLSGGGPTGNSPSFLKPQSIRVPAGSIKKGDTPHQWLIEPTASQSRERNVSSGMFILDARTMRLGAQFTGLLLQTTTVGEGEGFSFSQYELFSCSGDKLYPSWAGGDD